ncbi:hypothetical protein P5V15_000917 [Pogonomyrmex californicus]
MIKGIQMILSPLLKISYIFGLRIANLSKHHLKLWFSFLYMVLLWIFYFFITYPLVYFIYKSYPLEYHICYTLEKFITFLTIAFGIYHEKKFRNCLKKLDIIDDTLYKLGIVTDYNKLYKKTVWLVLGWFIIVVLINSGTALYVKAEKNCDILVAMYLVFIRNHSYHINVIDDLITATILGYIGLKFEQINQHLQNFMESNKYRKKQTWENFMIHFHRQRFSKDLSSKRITWIITHLHLELKKISYEIDSIFGTQMTFKMVFYFGWLVFDLREFFYTIFLDNFVKSNKILCAIISLMWCSHDIFKFLLINYMCETVSNKASITGKLINKLSYITCDLDVREIITQFSLQITYAPLKFYGVGFFEFGYKFFYKFIMSIITVLVIIIQAKENK